MIEILEETEKEIFPDKITTVQQPKTKIITIEDDLTSGVKVILLLVNNPAFKTSEKTYNLKICGKAMREWVENSVGTCPLSAVEYSPEEDFLSVIKPLADRKYPFTALLFSDTPLLRQGTFSDVIEYFKMKQLSVLKLTRGYVFQTNYLLTVDKLYSPQMQYFEEEDFITCYNLKQMCMVADIMKNRILSYHMKNGVRILDVNATYIDADVSVEPDVVIFPNTHIAGDSVVESGVIIKENTKIENSVIMKNSYIENSVIKDSVIKNNCRINSFCLVENKSVIGENTVFNGYNYVSNSNVRPGTVLSVFEKKIN